MRSCYFFVLVGVRWGHHWHLASRDGRCDGNENVSVLPWFVQLPFGCSGGSDGLWRRWTEVKTRAQGAIFQRYSVCVLFLSNCEWWRATRQVQASSRRSRTQIPGEPSLCSVPRVGAWFAVRCGCWGGDKFTGLSDIGWNRLGNWSSARPGLRVKACSRDASR